MDLLSTSLHSTKGGKISLIGEENTTEENETIDDSSECLSELAQTAFIDPNIQYQLHQETIKDGQITYRVVPISSVDKLNENGPIISDVNFSSHNPNATILQTSLQSLHPSSYIAMPGLENIRNHSRVALYSSDISDNSLLNNVNNATNSIFNSNYRDKSLIQGNAGHLVLMMSPELLQGHKLPSQNNSLSSNEPKGGKDEKRRFIHNEVERRRRDKINTWITKLSKIVPDCNSDQSKQGQSKGGILAKTADYIHELKTANESLFRALKEAERTNSEVERLRATNLDLASKLALFRSELSTFRSGSDGEREPESELSLLRQRHKELKQENCILMAFIKQHFPNVEIQITHTVRPAFANSTTPTSAKDTTIPGEADPSPPSFVADGGEPVLPNPEPGKIERMEVYADPNLALAKAPSLPGDQDQDQVDDRMITLPHPLTQSCTNVEPIGRDKIRAIKRE